MIRRFVADTKEFGEAFEIAEMKLEGKFAFQYEATIQRLISDMEHFRVAFETTKKTMEGKPNTPNRKRVQDDSKLVSIGFVELASLEHVCSKIRDQLSGTSCSRVELKTLFGKGNQIMNSIDAAMWSIRQGNNTKKREIDDAIEAFRHGQARIENCKREFGWAREQAKRRFGCTDEL
jgi:hypothetical protein